MTHSIPEELEKQLRQILGDDLPGQAVRDIHAAMELAGILESRGFSFKLKDLCPRSMTETAWRAVFSKDGMEFSANDPQSPLAVCKAALGALSPAPSEEDGEVIN